MMNLDDPRLIDKLWNHWIELYPNQCVPQDYDYSISTVWFFSKKFEQWLYNEHGLKTESFFGKKQLVVVDEEKAVMMLLKYM